MDFPIFNLNEFEQETGFKRKKLAANLDLLCQNLGFLIIIDHQISKEIICNQWRAVDNFFSQRTEMKTNVEVPFPGYPYGWIPPERESLGRALDKKSRPDLKMVFLSTMRNIKRLLAFWIKEFPTISIKCKNKSSIFRVVGNSINLKKTYTKL